MPPRDTPTYDVVLFGATGFTGALTAAHLLRRAPDVSRIALAGRSREKLEAVRERLSREAGAEVDGPSAEQVRGLALVEADVTDAASIRALAASTRVVITTVGPYVRYGEPLVAACAAAGTDYVDLTGEPEFIDRMYVEHHAEAARTGARIVHACGFDSIPHELAAYLAVGALPDDVPLQLRGYVRAGGTASGGTFHSAVGQFARVRQMAAAAKARRRAEPRPAGRRVHLENRPHRAEGAWALPMPTCDPQVIGRSAAALPAYGPDFTYGHYALVRRLPVAVGGVAGVGALMAAAQVPPLRSQLLKRLQPGDGPSAEKRAKSWFTVRTVGEGGGRRAVAEVRGGDPGYGETSRMLAESALALAHDDLPETAGCVTTVQAMGDALLARLREIGMTLEVVEEGAARS